jgi:N-acetylneuraminic acid mutarotase
MRTLLIIAIVYQVFVSSSAFGQWVRMEDPLPTARFAAMSFSLNDTGYVVGGIKKSGTQYIGYKELTTYSPETDSWGDRPAYPGGTIYAGIALGFDTLAIVGLGGNQSGALSNQLWSYDPATRGWKKLANFPGSRRVYPFYFRLGSKAYVGAGVTYVSGEPQYLNDLWEYDLVTNTWTERASYPGKGRVGIAAFAIGDRAFAGIGDDGVNFHQDLYEYDPVQDVWTQRANVVSDIRSFPQTIALGDKAYMIGGEQAHLEFTKAVVRYDPATDSWEALPIFPGTARRNAVLFAIKGQLFYGLGQVGPEDDLVVRDLWRFSPASSVTDNAGRDIIQVYPNPCVDQFYVGAPNTAGYGIWITNALGVTVLQSVSVGHEPIRAPETPGLYFYRIESSDGGMYSGKFQKVSHN